MLSLVVHKITFFCLPVLVSGMTAFTVTLLLSASAQASCGDYLAGHHSRSGMGHESRNEEAAVENVDSSIRNSHTNPSPCEGGNCDRAPMPDFPPASPPTSRLSDHHDQWGTLDATRSIGNQPPGQRPTEMIASSCAGHRLRIDRPPCS